MWLGRGLHRLLAAHAGLENITEQISMLGRRIEEAKEWCGTRTAKKMVDHQKHVESLKNKQAKLTESVKNMGYHWLVEFFNIGEYCDAHVL
jgi:hypothetical protein